MPFLVTILYQITVKAVKYFYGIIEYHEDSTPTLTTSLINVGLDEPKRSGAEYISVGSVILSPRKLPIVSTADSTVDKQYAMRR